MPTTLSAAALGFARLPGVNRRPNLAELPGLHTAIGALVCNANMSEEKLNAPMPRYIWYKAVWTPNVLADTCTMMAAKRLDAKWRDDILVPDLVPKDARITELPKNAFSTSEGAGKTGEAQATATAAAAAATAVTTKSKARTGPCSFGCETTTARQPRTGKPQWSSVPSPSPWPDKQPGETLCKKCYDKALALNKRKAMAQAVVAIHADAKRSEEKTPEREQQDMPNPVWNLQTSLMRS